MLKYIRKSKFLRKFFGKTYAKIKYKRMHQNFRKHGQTVLETLHKELYENDIGFFLVFGTLLGAVREKNFISHDNDIDIGVFYTKENVEKIKKILEKIGFIKVREISIDNGSLGYEETYFYKRVQVDIFYYYLDPENRMYTNVFSSKEGESFYETSKKHGGLDVNRFTFSYLPLKKYLFLGKEYLVPFPPEQNMKECYGESFMIPNSDWNYKRDSKAFVEIKNKKGILKQY